MSTELKFLILITVYMSCASHAGEHKFFPGPLNEISTNFRMLLHLN